MIPRNLGNLFGQLIIFVTTVTNGIITNLIPFKEGEIII